MLGHTPDKIDEFIGFGKKRFDSLTPWSYGTDRVGIDSLMLRSFESVPVMVREFEQRNDKPFNLSLAVPTDFEEVVNKRTDRRFSKEN